MREFYREGSEVMSCGASMQSRFDLKLNYARILTKTQQPPQPPTAHALIAPNPPMTSLICQIRLGSGADCGYFKIYQAGYKFNMSTPAGPPPLARRTSERRRLKMLRNRKEFKIANPYRVAPSEVPIPDELSSQLSKIDFLSHSAIALLALHAAPADLDRALGRMVDAQRCQEEKFQTLFGHQQTQVGSEHFIEDENHSVVCKEERLGTREDLSLGLMEPVYSHGHLFECDSIEEEVAGSESEGEEASGPSPVAMLDDDYEHYFMK